MTRIVPFTLTSPFQEVKIIDELRSGVRSSHVVSHLGSSQYSSGAGISSCGLAALNCAKILLGKEKLGVHDDELIKDIMQRRTLEDILEICTHWTSSSHLDVDDIYRTPMFHTSLKLMCTDAGRPTKGAFLKILQQLRDRARSHRRSTCALLTRPPEIISCFYLFNSRDQKDMFVIFDSHPRPDIHPEGAAFVFKTSIDEAANYLTRLLPFDDRLLEEGVQWQAQLLGNMIAHTIIARDDPVPPIDHELMRASIDLLALKSELHRATTENNALLEENKQLRETLKKHKSVAESPPKWSLLPSLWHPAPSKGPTPSSSSLPAKRQSSGFSRPRGWEVVPFKHEANLQTPSSSSLKPLGWEIEPSKPNHQNPQLRANPRSANVLNESAPPPSRQETRDIIVPKEVDTDLEFAMTQQRMYDEENARLSEERARLARVSANTHGAGRPRPIIGFGVFKCGICLDVHSLENVAKVEQCDHTYCRDCIRTYLETEIQGRKCPIFCPLCIVERDSNKSALNNIFVQQVGLSEELYTLFIELELATLSTMIHCPSCKNSFFVDKNEVRQAKTIKCPLPGCNTTWCKACSHKLDIKGKGPEHSCDGSSELKQLVKEKGWRYCPGCQTPAEKISGCNHISCTAPGCHTHYCYTCGDFIVQSTNQQEINATIYKHFSNCKLFEDIPDEETPRNLEPIA